MLEFCKNKNMISSLKPELIIVGKYHILLKKEIIDIPVYSIINMHGASLPRYRGAHPINWMIINGETEGTVTCHYITEDLDDGDILGQYFFPILFFDIAYNVRPRLYETEKKLLTDVLKRFLTEGKITGKLQDESKALYKPPRKPEDGLINWNSGSKQIYDFVRALTRPYPGAFNLLKDNKVFLWRVDTPTSINYIPDLSYPPGTKIESKNECLTVAVEGETVCAVDYETDLKKINVNDRLISRI